MPILKPALMMGTFKTVCQSGFIDCRLVVLPRHVYSLPYTVRPLMVSEESLFKFMIVIFSIETLVDFTETY